MFEYLCYSYLKFPGMKNIQAKNCFIWDNVFPYELQVISWLYGLRIKQMIFF